jgi:hypothetical protein
MKPDMFIAVVGSLNIVMLILLIIGLRYGEAGIDILRSVLMLGIFSGLHTRDVSILERAVLIESSTNEVGAVR